MNGCFHSEFVFETNTHCNSSMKYWSNWWHALLSVTVKWIPSNFDNRLVLIDDIKRQKIFLTKRSKHFNILINLNIPELDEASCWPVRKILIFNICLEKFNTVTFPVPDIRKPYIFVCSFQMAKIQDGHHHYLATFKTGPF